MLPNTTFLIVVNNLIIVIQVICRYFDNQAILINHSQECTTLKPLQ